MRCRSGTVMEHGSTPRRGLTVVELLVSIGVMSLLLSLVLPAVQSGREAARRTQCRASLHDIGIAVGVYEATWSVLPNDGPHPYTTGLAKMRAYLNYDYLVHPQPGAGSAFSVSSHENLFCPSDGVRPLLTEEASFIQCFGEAVGGTRGDGIAGVRAVVRDRDVSGGRSQTVCFSERLLEDLGTSYGQPGQIPPRPIRHVFLTRRRFERPKTVPAEYRSHCESLPGAAYSATLSFRESLTNERYGGFTTTLRPNTPACLNTSSPRDPFAIEAWEVDLTASSGHPGAVNCLFLDGSARTVGDQISVGVWSAVGSFAGNETVSFEF